MFLDPQIQIFINHLRAERGLSANTIDAYSNDLNQLSSMLLASTKAKEISWSKVNEPTLETVIIELKNAYYSDTSIARKLASLKSFFRFLHEENIVHSNPAEGIKAHPSAHAGLVNLDDLNKPHQRPMTLLAGSPHHRIGSHPLMYSSRVIFLT